MFHKINRKIAAVVLGLFLATGAGAAAGAAVANPGPPLTVPAASSVGPYFSGPVHACIKQGDEAFKDSYWELYSTMQGNCARGYHQVTVNEITPKFQFFINNTNYNCNVNSAQSETMIVCTAVVVPVPTPSPSSSASSSASG